MKLSLSISFGTQWKMELNIKREILGFELNSIMTCDIFSTFTSKFIHHVLANATNLPLVSPRYIYYNFIHIIFSGSPYSSSKKKRFTFLFIRGYGFNSFG